MSPEQRAKIAAALERPLPESKRCNVCGETKSADQFWRRSAKPTLLRATCRSCEMDAQRRARAARGPTTPVEKRCPSCRETKPAHDFGRRSGRPHLLRSRCYDCEASIERRDRARLNAADFDTRLAEQRGVCAICGESDPRRRLSIDHCHASGKIRGLLCTRCNSGLGMFCDDPARLRAAIRYLKR